MGPGRRDTRVVQANLHHAKDATAVLERGLSHRESHIALVQEPWVREGYILGLNAAGKLLYNAGGTKPRSCIVFSRHTNFLPVPELCSDDIVAAYVNFEGWEGTKIIICSAYLPYEAKDPTAELERVVDYARRNGAELLVGADANAHHTAWGSSDINARGDLLHTFLVANCLQVLNEGREPTFVTACRREVLDITFATDNLSRRISGWRVSDEPSMSDHRHIRFNVSAHLDRQTVTFRDPKATAWDIYQDKLRCKLAGVPKSIRTPDELDLAVECTTGSILNAYEESCPLKTRASNRDVPWWRPKLGKLREKARKLFNRAKRTQEWDAYSRALTQYSKELRKAKRASWRRFCEELQDTPQGARIRKILAKDKPNQIGLLKGADGAFAANEVESLELLISSHFPGAITNQSTVPPQRPRNEDWCRAARIIRPGMVKWAIKSFKPYKSSGPDNILPVLLQQGIDTLLPILVKLFRASFAWGYIPERWTKARVLFIPKAGRKDYSLPKSFRPICLTSFLLKTLEKVLDRFIREEGLRAQPIHHTQHAYCRGRSTETALLQLADRVEKALEDKQIALCAFLDIEGAFDNTPTDTLVNGLIHKHIDSTTVKWVRALLTSRKAQMSLHGTTIEVTTTRGCPQGGVLSPLLWTLAIDELLYMLAERGIDTLGYADDLTIIVRGFCESMLSSLLQNALNIVSRWCRANQLTVNADKTVVVPFTRRRGLKLAPPTLNGTEVKFSSEVKYLGVTFDQKLTWNSHLDSTIQKAKIALSVGRRLVGRRWGSHPKLLLWLYTAITRPTVSYASVVWWNKTSQATAQCKLNSLQRSACMVVTGAMSSTPGAALEALLNLPPLALHISTEARAAMLRAIAQGYGAWMSKTLRSLKDQVLNHPILGMKSDCIIPKLVTVRNYRVEIPPRSDWADKKVSWKAGSLIWYTDGSKMGRDVGCGVYGERPKCRTSTSLGRYASIFQAEVYAIIDCAAINIDRNYRNHTIYIHSDSQAALLALNSNTIKSGLVMNCIDYLNSLGLRNELVLRWVPGHADITGNECADELARTGAKLVQFGPEPICGLPKSTARLTLRNLCHQESVIHWKNTPGLTHSKTAIKGFDRKTAVAALMLNRKNLCTITRTLTGHCCLNKHLTTVGLGDTSLCRFCKSEDETPLHILCSCAPLMHKRNAVLGSYILNQDDVCNTPVKKILQFMSVAGLDRVV